MNIFISYARQDGCELARDLALHLRQMGYDPWLDIENGIPIGAPFDVAIETAISGSGILIALLTRESTKPEGFCRKELQYALVKKIPILPIKIHKVDLPIHIILLNYLDASTDNVIPYDKLPSLIELITKNGSVSYDPQPHQISWWNALSRTGCYEELARHDNTFTGRKWLFDDIQAWIEQSDSQLLLITADAGIGKSAIAAQMTTRFNVRGIHFCSRSNIETCFPKSWLSDLIYQLAKTFSPYQKEVEQLSAPNWNDPPESLFRSLIIEPLNRCEKQLNISEPWIFVIDGLDESLAEAGSALIDLLTESVGRLPAWFRIIVTSRPDQTIIAKFTVKGAQQYSIKASGDENKKDLQDYLEKYSMLKNGGSTTDRHAKHLTKINEWASGNFLFAKLALDTVTDPHLCGSIDFESGNTFPKNLSGLYDIMFRNRFKDQKIYDEEIIPLIDCLTAAQEPLPEESLIKASQLSEQVARKGLLLLSQFLTRSKNACQLFHQSLVAWLIDANSSTRFTASLKTGHRLLAEVCWADYQADPKNMPHYSRAHMPLHLVKNENWDHLLVLIKDSKLDLFSRWIEGGEGETGLSCLQGAIEYLDKHNREQRTAAGLATQTARIYSNLGKYDNAENWLKYALKKTSYLKGRRLKAIALHELGSLLLYKQEYQKSAKYYRKALRLCNWGLPAYQDEAAANLLGLATIYHTRYEFKKVLSYAKAALKKSKNAGDVNHYISGERLLGNAYKSLGQYDESRRYILNGLALAELGGAAVEKMRLLALQGWLEYEVATSKKELPEKSIPLFEQIMTASKNANHFFSHIEARLSLIWCDLAAGRNANLEEQLIAIRNDLPRDRHYELQIDADLALAAVKHQKRDWPEALELYQQVVLLSDQHGYRFLYSKAHVGLGAIYWHTGRKEEAEEMWRVAIDASNHIYKAKPSRIEISIEMCKKDPRTTPR